MRDGGVGARIEVLDSLSASKDPTVAKAARERLRLEKRKQAAAQRKLGAEQRRPAAP